MLAQAADQASPTGRHVLAELLDVRVARSQALSRPRGATLQALLAGVRQLRLVLLEAVAYPPTTRPDVLTELFNICLAWALGRVVPTPE